MDLNVIEQIEQYAFQYYGLDWLVALTVFVGIFQLGNQRKSGFIIGIISAALGLIFSFQIKSIANGLTSIVLLVLYLRGYMNWRKTELEFVSSDN